jgi:hypothetical protein
VLGFVFLGGAASRLTPSTGRGFAVLAGLRAALPMERHWLWRLIAVRYHQ